ncbi:hypothetical protein TRVL_05002 [Trypanosoma vivax]|nr:hypothetical protein TRVL_05002 [Trypanosoma vivax]
MERMRVAWRKHLQGPIARNTSSHDEHGTERRRKAAEPKKHANHRRDTTGTSCGHRQHSEKHFRHTQPEEGKQEAITERRRTKRRRHTQKQNLLSTYKNVARRVAPRLKQKTPQSQLRQNTQTAQQKNATRDKTHSTKRHVHEGNTARKMDRQKGARRSPHPKTHRDSRLAQSFRDAHQTKNGARLAAERKKKQKRPLEDISENNEEKKESRRTQVAATQKEGTQTRKQNGAGKEAPGCEKKVRKATAINRMDKRNCANKAP